MARRRSGAKAGSGGREEAQRAGGSRPSEGRGIGSERSGTACDAITDSGGTGAEGASEAGIGRLTVVATPIGNLGDLSPRALEALQKADVLACEDTSVGARLLAAHGLRRSIVRLDEHAPVSKLRAVVAEAEGGKK